MEKQPKKINIFMKIKTKCRKMNVKIILMKCEKLLSLEWKSYNKIKK